MDTSDWIAVTSAIIALATLIYGIVKGKQKADVDYVTSLERRVEIAEQALERCRHSEQEQQEIIEGLERKNLNMMRMVLELKGDVKK